MRIRFKTAALLTVLAAVAAFVAVDAARDTPPVAGSGEQTKAAGASEQATTSPSAEAMPAESQAFVLPERQEWGKAQSPLFESQTWQPPPPPPVARVKPPPPPPPTAPPLPYTFAGRLIHDGRLSLLLARGDSVIPIKEGETLDGVYRVESITESQITLVYLPLGQRQTIPVVTSLAATPPSTPRAAGATAPHAASGGASTRMEASAPIPSGKVLGSAPGDGGSGAQAKLAWTGPQQVKLGRRFEVSLRVNSSQPLHAWPMHLRVDPNHFEVVTVRAGKLPGASDPDFSYRMNPDGSIFIGASVQTPAAGAESELLALTLVPVKPASAAEVTIASLNLQGAAGRPIPYDRVAAFRTTITP